MSETTVSSPKTTPAEEIERLEKSVEESRQMDAIGAMIGIFAHDFNNLLGSIMGYSELCQFEISNPARAGEHLEQVLLAAERAQDLVRRIADLANAAQPSRENVSVVAVMDRVTERIEPVVPATLTVERIGSTQPETMANPGQLEQVLHHLCQNAIEAIGDGHGTLTVTIHSKNLADDIPLGLEPGPYVLVEVSDDGCGMEDEVKARAVKPFFTTKPEDDGCARGIGLSVARGIVNSHDGELVIETEVGRGTKCTVFLPCVGGHEPTSEGSSQDSTPSRILIVDDEDQVRDLLQSMLSHLGYQVTAASDAEQALSTFESGCFDLLFTDMTMPGMDGIELAREIRRRDTEIPILLLTGLEEGSSESVIRELGISTHLTKPIRLVDLSNVVTKTLAAKS